MLEKFNLQKFFLILLVCFLIYFIYSIKEVLIPFYLAIIASYVLQIQVNYLQKYIKKRSLATTFVCVIIVSFITVIVISVIPIALKQSIVLIKHIPGYVDYLIETLSLQDVLVDLKQNIKDLDVNNDLYKYITAITANIFNTIWISGLKLLTIMVYCVLVPVLTFYITHDWNIIIQKLSILVPAKHKNMIFTYCTEIDNVLRKYIIGQLEICVLLGIYYSVLLSIFKLKYGLLLGMIVGILSFIPYVGTGIGFIFGNLISFYQFDSWVMVFYINMVLVTGQIFEGYFVTPKVMSNSVQLSPVWIMFSILAGAKFAGFIGVILAIPIAAIIRVTILFAFKRKF
ncbi:MAG: hypothetical protein P857_947 [Candidatus Xenolissoclinum pacificiensis L6]|uniref:Permease n=1 Tax=Candidatus Xenolissoclinum pacificiensis L6 TaxID=1401685 RepID=W2V2A0_9RICK|nr:MAG: hypothetical protein P857_947 [Candidatus Xenolissoclinum pacificiensis L6]